MPYLAATPPAPPDILSLGNYADPPSGDATGVTDRTMLNKLLTLNATNNRPIYLQAGIYKIDQQLTATRDYFCMWGEGEGRTTIQAVAAMSGVLQLNGVENNIRDFGLDGNSFANYELDLQHTEASVRHMIERVRCLGNQVAPTNNTSGDGHITSTQTAFTSASGAFTTADVGKHLIIAGAGAGGNALVTTIAAFVSATAVTTADAAGTTVTTSNYQYWGTAVNNSGCEDTVFLECTVPNSEASPSTINPAVFLSTVSGAVELFGCKWFGPVFHNCLTLNVFGGVVGPLVAVNAAASTLQTVNVAGAWIYDGGTPTAYSPIDQCAGNLAGQTITRACHIVATNAASWVHGTIPSGGVLELGQGTEYVQPAANVNATMTILAIVAGATNTKSVFESGRISIGGSATTVNLKSGGSSSHAFVQRGLIAWAGQNVSATTTLPTAPGVGSTGTAVRNPFGAGCVVLILSGGATITNVSVDGTTVGTALSATDPTAVYVPAMGTITLSYTVATPTWVWVPVV